MEQILETIAIVWSMTIFLYLPALFMKKKVKVLRDDWHVGWDEKFDGDEYEYKYRDTELGRKLKAIGFGGFLVFLLASQVDIFAEIMCLFTLGIVDLTEDKSVLYLCIFGIAIMATWLRWEG